MNGLPHSNVFDEAVAPLSRLSLEVRKAPLDERLVVLRNGVQALVPDMQTGALDAAAVEDEIYQIANELLPGEPGGEIERELADIAQLTRDGETQRDLHAEATVMRLRMEMRDPRDRANAIAELKLLGEDVRDVTADIDEPQGEWEPPPVDSMDAYGAPINERADLPAGLKLVSPPAWRDVPLPPMQWLATNRVPAGDATILSGDGGGGKTTVALQLAVSVERGLGDWLGTTCEAGPVIFVSAEEPENEMRRRLERVARKRGIEPNEIANLHFHFASPENCLLGVALPSGAMGPTPLFNSLATTAAAIRPVLIIVDSIAGTFGGNQNDRVHARTFVGMFRRLAQDVDCAVLLLDHPSLSGITSGTGRGGSMDWQNATRARLHLETVTAEDGTVGRVLEMKKSNYGPVGDPVKLRWEDGSFVMASSAPAPQQAAAHAGAEHRYLECLDAMTAQGRHVCPGKGRGYAPKEFAEMQQANGMTARAFQAAQERLFAAGIIEVVSYGPPSRNAKRIARKA